jgi:hypothetical protein
VSEPRVKLDYESPIARGRDRPWPWFIIIPALLGAISLIGVVDGLMKGGFSDEGPLEAALFSIFSIALGLIGATLSLSRSRSALLCNAAVVALGIAGFVVAFNA